MLSHRRILQNDYYSRLYVVLMLVGLVTMPLGMIIDLLAYIDGQSKTPLFGLGLLITLIMGSVIIAFVLIPLVLRISKYSKTLAHAERVGATIKFSPYGGLRASRLAMHGGGMIVYQYTYRDQTYESWNVVWLTPDTAAIREGDKLHVYVRPEKPGFAILEPLYIKPDND